MDFVNIFSVSHWIRSYAKKLLNHGENQFWAEAGDSDLHEKVY